MSAEAMGPPGRLFLSEAETAEALGIHRTTLRTMALEGRAPVEPLQITDHKRVYRRADVLRLAHADGEQP